MAVYPNGSPAGRVAGCSPVVEGISVIDYTSCQMMMQGGGCIWIVLPLLASILPPRPEWSIEFAARSPTSGKPFSVRRSSRNERQIHEWSLPVPVVHLPPLKYPPHAPKSSDLHLTVENLKVS